MAISVEAAPVFSPPTPERPAHVVAAKLTKRYGAAVALDGLDLTVRAGEIYGLLGPNGAGKTTAISIMCAVVEPSSGTVTVGGHGVLDGTLVREQMGVVPQELALYDYLTGEENVRFFGRLAGLRGGELDRRCAIVLDLVGLQQRRRDLVREYSGGMKRRLNFAAGVVHSPRFVLLDEPLVSVDPQSRACLVDAIRRLRDDGATVLYTTHQLEEAEQLCDRIGILDRGRLVAEGTVEELTAAVTRDPPADPRHTGLTAAFLALTGRALRD